MEHPLLSWGRLILNRTLSLQQIPLIETGGTGIEFVTLPTLMHHNYIGTLIMPGTEAPLSVATRPKRTNNVFPEPEDKEE